MKYIWLFIVVAALIVGSYGSDLEKISSWLLGVNFTISAFSINFTFFGHQLSKYKPLYSHINRRQWLNISAVLTLPFIPLVSYLFDPNIFSYVALATLPILSFSAFDNAMLTSRYLDPKTFISNVSSIKSIDGYIASLSRQIRNEASSHDEKTEINKDKFRLPPHGYKFQPTMLGLENDDIWDSMTIVMKLSIENNDYSTFKSSLSAIFRILIRSHEYKNDNDEYKISQGVQFVTRKRFRSIVSQIITTDHNGVFLQSLSGELCDLLSKKEIYNTPCSNLTRAFTSEAIWIGQKMLESKAISEPLNILNAVQNVIEQNLFDFSQSDLSEVRYNNDYHNIFIYAHDIKDLGVSALTGDNPHFAFRCMESLSYLGCNAAKLGSTQTVAAVFESIVHLGRVSRNLGIGCFWSRCLISAESHAEEFLGHILTWLIHDLDENGKFFMKDYAEQAYSRIRGVKCVIRPKPNSQPIFWILEMKDDGGNTIPHIEYEVGMYGYSGQLDYSDFKNLKEYTLTGIGSGRETRIFYSEPIPLEL
ncbi:hypothetical protein [Aeromonas sp. S9(2024)]|uniref:hypothetical protein n=1 Tax=Aeromonas sp. S9(2024) TaxID=3242882 RepID=UPI0035285B84